MNKCLVLAMTMSAYITNNSEEMSLGTSCGDLSQHQIPVPNTR